MQCQPQFQAYLNRFGAGMVIYWFGFVRELAETLDARTQALLRAHDWFWVVTGVPQGGGLDCSMVIRKTGPPIGAAPMPSRM